jgi:hypothetical protein
MAGTGHREAGRSTDHSSIAIETSSALRLVFHQPLRQTEGLLPSIADVLKIDVAIPDQHDTEPSQWRPDDPAVSALTRIDPGLLVRAAPLISGLSFRL